LAAVAFGLATHLENVGVFDEAHTRWIQWLKARKPIAAKDIWAEAAADFDLPQQFQAAGLSESSIRWLREQLERSAVTFDIDDEAGATIRSDDRKLIVAVRQMKPARPGSVGDLIFAGRHAMAAAALREPTGLVAPVIPAQATERGIYFASMMDSVLAGVVVNLQDFTRQRRQLEDTGLPATQGSFIDWGTAIFIGIMLLAPGVHFLNVCIRTKDDLPCAAAGILLILAVFFLAGGVVEVASATSALEAVTNDWWEVRAADLTAYVNTVLGRL
jgi:hypothetical protein